MTPVDPSSSRGAASETPESERAVQWVQRAGAAEELAGLVRGRVRRRRQRQLAVAATACVAVVGSALFWRAAPSPEVGAVPVASAEAGGGATVTSPRRELLADGSMVEFKDGAEIMHDFSGRLRRVTLLRGEAHFQVAKDAERPFVVSAHGVEVRAVGTAFSVQIDAAAVEVVVTEGRVAVDAPRTTPTPEAPASPTRVDLKSPPEATAALLDAGHRASIRLGEVAPEVSVLAAPELLKRLAWRVPQLEFSRTRLGEIVALVNQHGVERGRKRIVIDPAFADLSEVKLSGFLAADNTMGLVRLLETNFQVEATESADEIVVRRRR